MPVRVRVIGEGDAVLILQANEPGHGVRTGAVHPDDAVVIDRHERERRIEFRIHHGQIELVDGTDRFPIRQGGATERIDAEFQAGGPNGIHIHDVPQVVDVRQYEVFLVSGARLDRLFERHTLHTCIALLQQLVGPILNPPCHVGIRRTALRWVVLEATVLRWIVRGRDDNAVRDTLLATAIVDENRPRNHRGRCHAIVRLDDRLGPDEDLSGFRA